MSEHAPTYLHLNENPRPPSKAVANAVLGVLSGLNRYPKVPNRLHGRLAEYLGNGLTVENISVGHGGVDVLHQLAVAFLHPGDEAIVPRPNFPVYVNNVANRGASLVQVELNDYRLDTQALLDAVTPATRMMYLTSPHNPCGSLTTQDELDWLMEYLPDHVLLVFDEVYWHFASDPDQARAWKHVHADRNVVALHSFSKAFGMAGLRLGYAVSSPRIKQKFCPPISEFRVNLMTEAAGLAALEDTEGVRESIRLMQEGCTVLYNALSEMDGVIRVLPSQASFVAFRPDCSGKWLESQLADRNILVRELSGFQMPGWVRISVGNPGETEQCLSEVADILSNRP